MEPLHVPRAGPEDCVRIPSREGACPWLDGIGRVSRCDRSFARQRSWRQPQPRFGAATGSGDVLVAVLDPSHRRLDRRRVECVLHLRCTLEAFPPGTLITSAFKGAPFFGPTSVPNPGHPGRCLRRPAGCQSIIDHKLSSSRTRASSVRCAMCPPPDWTQCRRGKHASIIDP
jgi:hypothetical protein